MLVKANKSDVIAALSVFILISIPSVKLLYSSSFINFIPVIGMILAIFLKGFISELYDKKIILLSWSSFSIVLMFSFLWNFGNIDARSFNFIFLIVVVFLSIIVLNEAVFYYTSFFLIFWCAFIALWQLLIGVPYKAGLGQTYLTVAMPLGALFTMSLFGVTSSLPKKIRIYSLFLSVLAILSLGTLLSRGAMILPLLILSIHLLIMVFYSKSVSKKFITLVLVFIIAGLGIWAFNYLELRQLYRLEMLFNNLGDEPRVAVYNKAIALISDSPLVGYGVGSTADFFNGTYPHNIFLDVFINGGILLLIPFFFIVSLYLRMVRKYYKFSSKYSVALPLLTMLAFSAYYLFQWNISWGLDSSYIPLVTTFYFIFYMQKIRYVK